MELIGLIGYCLAAIAFFAFFLLILAARYKTLAGNLIAAFAIVSAIAAATSAAQIKLGFSLNNVFYFEYIKIAICSVLLLATNKNLVTLKSLLAEQRMRQFMLLWTVALVVLIWERNFSSGGSTYAFQIFLVFDLLALILLEQIYRNADISTKWALWPMIIALGTIIVFEFVMFSQASLVNHLDFNFWYARGYVLTLSMPFLLISTKRIKNWSVNVFVSRNVVFYSSMLVICGAYLVLMALAGYVINYIGGHWGTFFSIAFLVLGLVVLVALLLTERLRREVKVFITKHFFANKYDYRVEWMKMIDLLEKGDSSSFYKTAVNIFCSTLQVEKGTLVKVASNNTSTVAYQKGLSVNAVLSELKKIAVFCKQQEWIIDINEYHKIENAYRDLAIDSKTFLDNDIAIIVPIYTNDELTGLFLAPAKSDSRLLNWEDRDLLSAISKQLSQYISLHETQIALGESKQFDAFNRMSAFLVHDLKNIQAQLQLINTNAKRHKNNPEFIDDAFETVDSATTRLNKVLQQLRNKQVAASESNSVVISEILEKIVDTRNQEQPQIALDVETDGQITLDAEKFASVINHLLQNAQEATENSGWVKLRARTFEQQLHIDISDNGCGMSQDFIENRLFKPFDTTKGNAGMGIGVYEAKQYIDSLDGKIQVTSFEGKGTSFQIKIPVNLHR